MSNVDNNASVDRAAEARRAAEAAAAQQAKQAQQTQQTQQTEQAQQEATPAPAATPTTETAAAEPTRTPASPETQQATRERALGSEAQVRASVEQGARPASSSLSLVPPSSAPTTAARGLQRASATDNAAAAPNEAAKAAAASTAASDVAGAGTTGARFLSDEQLTKRKQQLDALNSLEGKRPSDSAAANASQSARPDASAAGAESAQNAAPVQNAAPGTTTTPEARPTGPARPYADTPWHRERVNRIVDGMARRLGRDPAKLTPNERQRITKAAERMAHLLGASPTNDRGWNVLEKAVRTGTVGVGLAGIHGPTGGSRSDGELEQTRRDMSGAGGQEVDAVLDNDHGALEAVGTLSNRNQVNRLRELGGYMNELGINMNVTAHSNGFNALATVAREGNVRFGNVTLVNPNIPGSSATTTEGMRAIKRQSSGRVGLVTSVDDGIVPMTPAGITNGGQVWRGQIRAAVDAGFDDITVLHGAGHNLDQMSAQRERERENLDFVRNPTTGRMEPANPDAWRERGWAWHPERGFTRLRDPRERPLGRAA